MEKNQVVVIVFLLTIFFFVTKDLYQVARCRIIDLAIENVKGSRSKEKSIHNKNINRFKKRRYLCPPLFRVIVVKQ